MFSKDRVNNEFKCLSNIVGDHLHKDM